MRWERRYQTGWLMTKCNYWSNEKRHCSETTYLQNWNKLMEDHLWHQKMMENERWKDNEWETKGKGRVGVVERLNLLLKFSSILPMFGWFDSELSPDVIDNADWLIALSIVDGSSTGRRFRFLSSFKIAATSLCPAEGWYDSSCMVDVWSYTTMINYSSCTQLCYNNATITTSREVDGLGSGGRWKGLENLRLRTFCGGQKKRWEIVRVGLG